MFSVLLALEQISSISVAVLSLNTATISFLNWNISFSLLYNAYTLITIASSRSTANATTLNVNLSTVSAAMLI